MSVRLLLPDAPPDTLHSRASRTPQDSPPFLLPGQTTAYKLPLSRKIRQNTALSVPPPRYWESAFPACSLKEYTSPLFFLQILQARPANFFYFQSLLTDRNPFTVHFPCRRFCPHKSLEFIRNRFSFFFKSAVCT